MSDKPLEWCRSCSDQEPPVSTPACYIVWGKLFPPEMLGPRCLDCFYDEWLRHMPHAGSPRIRDWAIFDLTTVRAREDVVA